MSVVSGLAVSVDGYVTGPDPSPDQALGRGGQRLFDWYFDGDVPSQVFEGFRLSEPSQRFFDALAGRLGAVICGRTTYDHSSGFGGGSPHPSAPLVVLTHRPVPEASEHQTVAHGIEEAIARAAELAGDRDIGLMGTGVTAAALEAGLLDEITLHQVPVLLGGGTPYFHALPAARSLERVGVVEAPGVTHLTFRVVS
ncbi:dihydrofolate reductase family protein [Jiangella alkaliphila]|uniref:Dihydrofolate reductase n=1 Tax=Jiangella alkaliphila TaxID=419479 RepID=A0A1H2KR76_9ACTN|nr:dihydrofolate reductase family protein [Jiangella alkaliphila]SDU70866.1 Dihydrofolate reductase [Jiangella alkaliphila]